MYNEGSSNPIKAPIAKIEVDKEVIITTTYGDKVLIEALVNEDKKLVFTVQETSNKNFVISLLETYVYDGKEFKNNIDENQSMWKYIDGINVCDAVSNYCNNTLECSVSDVAVIIDTTDQNSCMTKLH
jgi:hypothetical protein